MSMKCLQMFSLRKGWEGQGQIPWPWWQTTICPDSPDPFLHLVTKHMAIQNEGYISLAVSCDHNANFWPMWCRQECCEALSGHPLQGQQVDAFCPFIFFPAPICCLQHGYKHLKPGSQSQGQKQQGIKSPDPTDCHSSPGLPPGFYVAYKILPCFGHCEF